MRRRCPRGDDETNAFGHGERVRMMAGSPWMHSRWMGTGRLWLAGFAVILAFGLAHLLVPRAHENPQRAAVLQTTTAAAAPLEVVPPAWSRLSANEQRTLEPLRDSWTTMTVEQQRRWRLVAAQFHDRSRQSRHRLAARIAEWARLSPRQRAHIRQNFLSMAEHYSAGQRNERWQAYQRSKAGEVHPTTATTQRAFVLPGVAQASPGATTVLLSRIFDLPSLGLRAEPGDDVTDSQTVGEATTSSVGTAPAAVGIAADAERDEQ